MAIAASILTAIYHMLKDGTMYNDLGRNDFDRRSTDQQKSAWSNVWPTLATLWRSSRSPPEPCLWRRQQGEFAVWPEQVSFLLAIPVRGNDGAMELGRSRRASRGGWDPPKPTPGRGSGLESLYSDLVRLALLRRLGERSRALPLTERPG